MSYAYSLRLTEKNWKKADIHRRQKAFLPCCLLTAQPCFFPPQIVQPLSQNALCHHGASAYGFGRKPDGKGALSAGNALGDKDKPVWHTRFDSAGALRLCSPLVPKSKSSVISCRFCMDNA
mgnify:CR=1 FL=1